MDQREIFSYYNKCSEELERVYGVLRGKFNTTYPEELAMLRGYVQEHQINLIREMKLGYCDVEDLTELGDMRDELGLVKKDWFLLNGRHIVPVYDYKGKLISLIGYFNDEKKYITLPTPFFSKSNLFFNFKQAYELSWEKFNGVVFLVEGIFDCLSLRSIGLPAIATMGASVKETKEIILRCFKRVVAIPDDDKTGRKAIGQYGWCVPTNTIMVKFMGGVVEIAGEKRKCKDIDNFVSWYDKQDVINILMEISESKNSREELSL